MAILSTACVHLAVLLVALRTTIAAPMDELTQAYLDIFRSPEEYTEEDKFVPPSESSFDAFDWRLCQILHKREPGSLVVSPVSLKLVLAMVYEGAEKKTALELQSALDLPTDRVKSRDKYHKILQSLAAKEKDLVMEVASKMFMRNDVTPQTRYKRILRYFYNADLQQLDFSQGAEAVQTINSWVSKATHGHIDSMLDEGVVSPSTMVLLLNAIYFKGYWMYQFNPNNTATGSFQVTPTKSVSVPFMNMTEHLYYLESDQLDAKLLRLPYKGRKYSMFIVLPNKPDGLDKLVKTVNPSMLRKNVFLMYKSNVNLVFPKFNFEFTTELEDVLQEMGIHDMFSSTAADFPGIVQGKTAYVSKVLQKAALDVNEEGTEAYVSTGVTLDDRMGGENEDFHAKHPFMFYIQDEKNGTVVFVGKVVDPTNSDTPLMNSKIHNVHSKEQDLSPSSKAENKSSEEDKKQENELNGGASSKNELETSNQ